MSRNCSITPARPGEGAAIASLIQRSIPPALRRLTIWQSPRIGPYVESLLAAGEKAAFYVLRLPNHAPVGVAALRAIDGAAFLDHLYVAPQQRGLGLGRRLLAEAFVRYLGRRPASILALDVFAGQPCLEAWYARLGFTEVNRRTWRVASLRAPAAAFPQIPDLAHADRRHAECGFSSFHLATRSGRTYEIGRLPGPFFRLTAVEAATDPDVLLALAALDPARRLLLISPGAAPGISWRDVAVSRRLHCPTASLCLTNYT